MKGTLLLICVLLLAPMAALHAAEATNQTPTAMKPINVSIAAAAEAVRAQITAAVQAMKLPPPVVSFKVMSIGDGVTEENLQPATNSTNLPSPPEADQDQQAEFSAAARFWAQNRLKAVKWISYSLVILLLAGSGFAELYVSKANVWSKRLGRLFRLDRLGIGGTCYLSGGRKLAGQPARDQT